MKIKWCHKPFLRGPRHFGIDFRLRKLIKIQIKTERGPEFKGGTKV